MKHLGNLAVVCAAKKDVLLQIHNGVVSVHYGEGPTRETATVRWDDDEAISGFVHELNYGKYAKEERMIQNERIIGKAA